VDKIKKSSIDFIPEDQLALQSEAEELQRSNIDLQERIKYVKAENYRLNATLRNNKRVMGNELATKQLRSLLKHSDQSKLNMSKLNVDPNNNMTSNPDVKTTIKADGT